MDEYINQMNNKISELYQDWQNSKNIFVKKSKLQDLSNKVNNIENVLARNEIYSYKSDDDISKKNDLLKFIRYGVLSGCDTKSGNGYLSTQENGGGYTISPNLYSSIVGGTIIESPMRGLASVDFISGNSLEVILEDGNFDAGWVSETELRPDDTKTATLHKKKINLNELYAQPMISQSVLDYTVIDLIKWLVDSIRNSFSELENTSFILGDGKGKPRGILYKPEETKAQIINIGSESNEITFDALLQMVRSLSDQYIKSAVFLMHRSTLTQIQLVKDNAGRLIWQQPYAKAPDTIFGIPVICCDKMPIISSKVEDIQYPIALADFKAAYKIIDRGDIQVNRDPYTAKPFVKFYVTKRVGGEVINGKAMSLLQLKSKK